MLSCKLGLAPSASGRTFTAPRSIAIMKPVVVAKAARLVALAPATRSHPFRPHAATCMTSTWLRYPGKPNRPASYSTSPRDIKASYSMKSQDVPLLTSRPGLKTMLGLAVDEQCIPVQFRHPEHYKSLLLDYYQIFGIDEGLAEAKALLVDPGLAKQKYLTEPDVMQNMIHLNNQAKMMAVEHMLKHGKFPGTRNLIESVIMSQNVELKNFKTEKGIRQLLGHAEDVFDSGSRFLMLQEVQHYTAQLQCNALNLQMPGRAWKVVMPKSQKNERALNLAILYDALEYELVEEKHHFELQDEYQFKRCPISATFRKLQSNSRGDAGQLMTLINVHNKAINGTESWGENWQNLDGVLSLLHQHKHLALAVGDLNVQVFPGKNGPKARVAAEKVRQSGIAACVHGTTNARRFKINGSMTGEVEKGDEVYDGVLIAPPKHVVISERLEAKTYLRPDTHLFGTERTTVAGSNHQGLYIPRQTILAAMR